MGKRDEDGARRPTDAAHHSFSLPALCCKRVFDLAVSLAALVLLAPLFGLIALLIKLDSRGPVFFRQVRVGQRRRRFRMWKFRKMYHNLPTQGPNLTKRYDTRLTRIGRLLERTKLDELPQFFNVLAGSMSIVGPRPEVPPFVEYYSDQWDRILMVKPGIVGPCQVRFRNESELYPEGCRDIEGYYIQHILPAKLAIDADYAAHYSLARDVLIFIQAMWVSCAGILTRQTLVNRRWQILNTLLLSLAGFAGTLAVTRLFSNRLNWEAAERIILFSALIKLVCVILFKIPKALATSVTADDLLRCCWCATVSGSLLGCSQILMDFRDLGRFLLLADTILFLTLLVLFKLGCYNIYTCFFRRKSWGLWQRLVLASLVLGPCSMAAVLTVHHGFAAWENASAIGLPGLILLSLAIRPVVLLFKPISLGDRSPLRLFREWMKIFLGSLVGSSLIVSGTLLLNEREISRLDVICDGVLYLSLMMSFAWWNQWRDRQFPLFPDGRKVDTKERLLIVGEGNELGSYISALAALPEHRFEVVGALSTCGGHRTNMVGGIPVLGEIADAPDVVRAMQVTRVVVVDTDIQEAFPDELRFACALKEEQVVQVQLLAPLMCLS